MNPQDALQHYFKLDAFRNDQESIVETILSGQDTLVIMPTGGGKSLCYQLPSLIMPGVTVVISPLISLMQDQVDSLEKLDIPVTLINSTLTPEQVDERFRELLAGKYKLLYVAPERFRSSRFTQALSQLDINFFAIDEAHCISQWGHDFRPDYIRLGASIEFLGPNRPPIAAFTATATPIVKDDIVTNLKLQEPKTFLSGFSRPNLSLQVIDTEKNANKYAHLGKLIEEYKTGIIYCATRKRVEKVAATLMSWDTSLVSYHGGMSDDERKHAQDRFMEGKVDVAVATNAFGMGIDRSDIRFVAHFEMPGSVEAYYQEVGRAGRDGNPSLCQMYYNYADKRVQEFFIEGSNPSKQLIGQVWQQLQSLADNAYSLHISIDELAERVGRGTNGMAVGTALSILSRAGAIERFDSPGKRTKGTRLITPDAHASELRIDYEALKAKQDRDYNKLEEVIRFASALECRQQWILSYFGESDPQPCGECDHCKAGSGQTTRMPTESELLIVQKALSGVARMSWRTSDGDWIPRFGRNKITQMLLGANTQAMRESSFNTLSTYGILKNQGKTYLSGLFKELERIRAIKTVTSENYPLITLTPYGEKIMRAETEYQLVWPNESTSSTSVSTSKSKTSSEDPGEGVDDHLYEHLRQTRVAVAKTMRNARLFMVLSNKTLKHLATLKPTTIDEARDIPGIGPAKMTTVLPKFIEAIKEYESQQLAASS